MPKRRIICDDAIAYLESGMVPPCAIITSPPEAAELKMPLDAFARWYRNAIKLCCNATAPGAPVVIYSTDRKGDGKWLSKPYLVMAVAEERGWKVMWHKIVLRRKPGAVDLHRPAYTHLIAIGDSLCRPGTATPDVIERGHMLYRDAMGFIPARLAVDYAGAAGVPIVDPFCGRGTVPAIAEALGFDAIGVDIDPEQCRYAEALSLTKRSAINAGPAVAATS